MKKSIYNGGKPIPCKNEKCGKQFLKITGNQRFCSKECKTQAGKAFLKQKRITDPKWKAQINKKCRNWYYENHAYALAFKREERAVNLEKAREKDRAYYHRSKDEPGKRERRKAQAKKWRNTPEAKAVTKANYERKMKTNPSYYLTVRLRSRISSAIKEFAKGRRKANNTIALLGCTPAFFMKYIEKKFTKGMTWERVLNGEIHMDHIKPCCSFDLTKTKEQFKCFNYKNIQPLWAADNYSKIASDVKQRLSLSN